MQDDPARGFSGNAFFLNAGGSAPTVLTPGISFFDRGDQIELCKLHLPYVLRTRPGSNLLFMPLLNRANVAFDVLSGLVETDWYPHPVNLVLRRPIVGEVTIAAGDPVAQVILSRREDRQLHVRELSASSPDASLIRQSLARWYVDHAKNRSAYKYEAKSKVTEPE